MLDDEKVEVDVVLPRKAALKTAWKLFWFATGTSRVGVRTHKGYIKNRGYLEFVGSDRIKDRP